MWSENLIYKGLTVLLCLVFFSRCEWDRSGKIYHPTKENVPPKEKITSEVSLDIKKSKISISKDGKSVLEKINNGKKVSTFGKSNRKGFLPFDMIKDLVVTEDGYIFLLVDNLKKVLVFDVNGNYVTHLGQRGRGPGDFLNPISLSTDKEGNIYILDKFEIDIFSFVDNELKFSNSIKHKLTRTWDLCVMGGTAYISGYTTMEPDSSKSNKFPMRVAGPIRSYDLDNGEPLEYFGKYYNSVSGWPTFTGKLSAMKLACNSTSETVVSIYKHFPFLYGYTPNGKEKWVSKISGYRYRKIYES